MVQGSEAMGAFTVMVMVMVMVMVTATITITAVSQKVALVVDGAASGSFSVGSPSSWTPRPVRRK
jgi:hypothetical protein